MYGIFFKRKEIIYFFETIALVNFDEWKIICAWQILHRHTVSPVKKCTVKQALSNQISKDRLSKLISYKAFTILNHFIQYQWFLVSFSSELFGK